MTSNTGSGVSRRQAPLARLLAFVLLAFVTYTTTAESVHRHDGLALNPFESSIATVTSSGDANPLAQDSTALGDCLICQLRQQLSFSLLNNAPQIVAPPAQLPRMPAIPVSFFSRSDAPQRGRAPPAASLL